MHFNYRYFEVIDAEGKKHSWFGGGTDLTPYFLDEQVTNHMIILQRVWIKNFLVLDKLLYHCKQSILWGIYSNHIVCLFIFLVSTTPPWIEPVLMKRYTVAAYDLRMCKKEDNTSPKFSLEII